MRYWTSMCQALLIILLVAAAGLSPVPAGAATDQQLPQTIAAVIDYQRILRDASAARSIRDQIEDRRETYQAEISEEEQRLQQADEAFAKQRSLLTPDALAAKRKELEDELAEVQRLVQDRRRQLDQVSADALNEVKEALVEIVTGIAERRGFNLVLPSSEVLFFDREIDLTEEVLVQLDDRLPQVAISDAID